MAALEKICKICGRSRSISEDFCPYCTALHGAAITCAIPQRSSSSDVDTGLETRWGGGPENPTVEEMRTALAELEYAGHRAPKHVALR